MKIELTPYSSNKYECIGYDFSPINLSDKDFVSFFWYGNDSGLRIALRFWSGSWKNQFEFVFIDSWKGWARLIAPRSYFTIHAGSPSWDNITSVRIVFYEEVKNSTIFYLDRITADSGLHYFIFVPLDVIQRLPEFAG